MITPIKKGSRLQIIIALAGSILQIHNNIHYTVFSCPPLIFRYFVILDSERSDECIDFTIMCVFYLIFFFLGL